MRQRARRIAKWTGLVGTTILSALWCVSLEWNGIWRLEGWGAIGFAHGCFVRAPEQGLARLRPVGITFRRLREDRPLIPPAYDRDKFGTAILAIWVLWVPIAVGTVVMWQLDRTCIPRGHCRCGYNLTGNISGVCPECGTRIPLKTGSVP